MIEERIQERQRLAGTARRGAALTTADLVRRSEPAPAHVQPVAGAPEQFQRVPLFQEGDLDDSRRRWQDVQASFVDNPQTAVRDADELVASHCRDSHKCLRTSAVSLRKIGIRGQTSLPKIFVWRCSAIDLSLIDCCRFSLDYSVRSA